MRRTCRGPWRSFLALGSLVFLLGFAGCATYGAAAASLNNFITREDYGRAKSFLSRLEERHSVHDRLLFLLDKGYVLHLAKDYRESIEAFEQAKKEYDRLYTRSVAAIAGSLLLNDYVTAYRGEDFERVMINIFEALDYFALNDLENALVEARDVDEELRVINGRYTGEEPNVYREDAFARFLMGIFYEASRTPEGYNNAFISYAKAAEIYVRDYERLYRVGVPDLLKENLFAAAQFMGPGDLAECRTRYGDMAFDALADKAQKAQIYLIQYNGPPSVKVEIVLPVVFMDGQVVTLAFPRYERRAALIRASTFSAQDPEGGTVAAQTQVVQDIAAIASKTLENKRARIVAKALVASAGKYFAQKALRRTVEKELGHQAEMDYILLSSLFNIYTGRADLRSWQTLPSEIRLSRLSLMPGEYHLNVDHFDVDGKALGTTDLGTVQVSAGETRFLIIRTMP